MFKLASSTKVAGIRATPSARRVQVKAATEVAELAGLAEAARGALGPAAEFFGTLGLPEPLVKYGHPGNMAVVLGAMGGYGTYLGFQIRSGDATEEKAKLHASLMAGMFVFFALGATGGVMSLIMQGKPLLESGHFVSACLGLSLLATQACLPLFFEEAPDARTAHAYLGSFTMLVFVIHAVQGAGLALSL